MTASASAASERRKETAPARATTSAAKVAAKPIAKPSPTRKSTTPVTGVKRETASAQAAVFEQARKTAAAPKSAKAKSTPITDQTVAVGPESAAPSPARAEPVKAESLKPELVKVEAAKPEADPKREPAGKPAKTEMPVIAEMTKNPEPAKLEPAKLEPVMAEIPARLPMAPPPVVKPAPVLAVAKPMAQPPLPPDPRAAESRPPERRTGPPGGPIVIPRAPAKAEIFQEGDHVVYPTHGVGKVERIVTEEIAGHRLELIHITFEENRMTLRVPVAKARTAGLRKLASRKLFDDALGVLKGKARIKRTMWSRRAQEYEAKINSGDPLAIAEVVRDLHRNAGQPDQSFSERQIYEAAMDRLAAELAALDKTDKPTAAQKLADFLKTV